MLTYTQAEIDSLNSERLTLNVYMSMQMIDFLKKGDFENARMCLEKGANPLYHNPNKEEENMNVLHTFFYLYWNLPDFSTWVEYDIENKEDYSYAQLKMFDGFELFLKTWKAYGGDFNKPVQIPESKSTKELPGGQNRLRDFYYYLIFDSYKQNKEFGKKPNHFYALNEMFDYMNKIINTGDFNKLEPQFINSNALGIMIREAWPYGHQTFVSQLNINQTNIVDSQGNTPLHYFYNARTMLIPQSTYSEGSDKQQFDSYIMRYKNNIETYFDVENVLHIKNPEGLTPIEAALKEGAWHCLIGLMSLSEKHTPDYGYSEDFMLNLRNALSDLEEMNKNQQYSIFIEELHIKKTNMEKNMIKNSLNNSSYFTSVIKNRL